MAFEGLQSKINVLETVRDCVISIVLLFGNYYYCILLIVLYVYY